MTLKKSFIDFSHYTCLYEELELSSEDLKI